MNILMWGIGVVKDHWISMNKEDSCTFGVREKLIDFLLDQISSRSLPAALSLEEYSSENLSFRLTAFSTAGCPMTALAVMTFLE